MGVAIVLVAAVSIGINQSWLLSADILKGEIASASAGDVSYHTDESSIRVTSEKTFHDVTSLTFMIVYNPETVTVNAADITTAYDYTSSSWKDWVAHVTVFLPETLEGEKEIIAVPYAGNADDITISDAKMLFKEWTIDGLAIKKQ